jgi:2-keto-4-pentenoate hydratase/2-oxohepta-3-ene-1,7-dioic acid hydratase (catechol pathway)
MRVLKRPRIDLRLHAVNDVTAADLLNENPHFPQWCRAKGFDTFCCIGPAIVSGFDWRTGRLVTTLDGVERQNYPLADMVFSPAEQVRLISQDSRSSRAM